jgi:hypothetical protein
VKNSILEKVLTKHGVVCLRTVPYLKEEGELLNGSHGKKDRNTYKKQEEGCNKSL